MGEHEATLELSLEDTAQDLSQHKFRLVLHSPDKAALDENQAVCLVVVDNDISAGTCGFKDKSPVEIKQSKGLMSFQVRRADTLKGMIKVPYKIETAEDSPYFS